MQDNVSPPAVALTAKDYKLACNFNSNPFNLQSGSYSDRDGVIAYLQLWNSQVPPWLLNNAVPVDFKRVRDYCDMLKITIPPWIAAAAKEEVYI